MQQKYLKEIQEKFKLPVVQFPMMQEEIKGLKVLNQALLNWVVRT
ncbi:MAG TPA: hypothetical protein DDW65_19260 [Firmicutes bacterium]|jgi:hypothetical protein|nr:hypothetical protein [Bacillota bacterium]